MKALTLYQPWASLIARGIKTIETRSWSTDYRGRLLIHAAKRPIGNGTLYIGDGISGPLGAVVASCMLTDVVPMVGHHEDRNDGPFLRIEERTTGATELWIYWYGSGCCRDVTGQLPYGDFAAGRYAWLLDDIQPTTERCPRCYLRPYPIVLPTYRNDPAAIDCPTCRGDGRCDPVPMRGRRGLWAPTAQDWSSRDPHPT